MSHSWKSFEDVISQASEILRDYSQHEFGPGVLEAWAGDANREFARRSEILRARADQPIIPGQARYRLPQDCVKLRSVRLLYPGYTDIVELSPIEEEDVLDGFSDDTQGRPQHWYVDERRTHLGLWHVPNQGGFIGRTSGAGNAGGTTVVASTAGQTDDFFNDLTLRILTGDLQGEEQTISDYDSGTGTFTVSSAFSAQVASGVRIAVAPTSLQLIYQKRGLNYTKTPVSVEIKDTTPLVEQLSLTLPQRPENFWNDCELAMTSGNADLLRARILTSTWDQSNSWTVVTLDPELPVAPSTDDTALVTQIPDIPPDYHHFLVHYIVAEALSGRNEPERERMHRSRFDGGVDEATRTFSVKQIQEFQAMNEFSDADRDYFMTGRGDSFA